ncbi:MAG: cytidine deaminase [Candidatus Diapherotrites archaeon]|nr:cytidine deaminase [Candidatus Diapherotrites archaeon]
MIAVKLSKLRPLEKKLLKAAESALKNAYNPYTRTTVGAAVLSKEGKIFKGSSFANQSSGSNVCAERAAVLNANTNGFRKIEKLAIFENDSVKGGEPAMPCGICLQFLEELPKISGKDLEIITSNDSKTRIFKTKLSELLPFPYNGSNGKKAKR